MCSDLSRQFLIVENPVITTGDKECIYIFKRSARQHPLVARHMFSGFILAKKLDRVLIKTDEDHHDRPGKAGEEDHFQKSNSKK